MVIPDITVTPYRPSLRPGTDTAVGRNLIQNLLATAPTADHRHHHTVFDQGSPIKAKDDEVISGKPQVPWNQERR